MATLEDLDRAFPLGTKVWHREALEPGRWYVVVGVATGFAGASEKRRLLAVLSNGFVDHFDLADVVRSGSHL